MHKTNIILAALLVLPSALQANTAAGLGNSETGTTRIDTSRVVDLDELVVVSQPKEALRLRQQPLSSSVFTDRELTMHNVKDMSRLAAFVPTLAVPNYGSRLTSSTYIRCIG